MQKKLKVALLSDVPPDSKYTGGQVLKRIIDFTPFIDVDFFWLNQSKLSTSFRPDNQTSLAYETTFSNGNFLNRIFRIISRLSFRSSKIEKCTSVIFRALKSVQTGFKLRKILASNQYDYLWLVLQGEILTIVYFIVSWRNESPIIFQQWDPISWWSSHRGHGKCWSYILEKLVSLIEKRAFLNLIPSYNWQKIHLSQRKSSHRIDNFISPSELPTELPRRAGEITETHAVFVGQFYSNTELNLLVNELADYTSKQGKKLILHYFGAGTPQFSAQNLEIMNHGFVSKETLISTIGQWDFALLPYPTDQKFELASKYSFPSKSRIYLAAGLPILSYAKSDSSPHLFYTSEYSKYYQNVLVQKDIKEFITNACDRSENATKERISAAKNIIDQHFSESAELIPLHNILLDKKI